MVSRSNTEEKPRYLQSDPFWSNPKAWPIDGPEQVFLARAVDRLGAARFGAAWIGAESGGRPKQFPSAEDRKFADRDQVLKAASMLRSSRPALWSQVEPTLVERIEELRATTGDRMSRILARRIAEGGFSFELWDEAETIESEQSEVQPGPAEQWSAITSELTGHLQEGSIVSYTRPIEGGAFRTLDKALWNYEFYKMRFRACRFDEDEPYSKSALTHDSESGRYVYVNSQNLDQVAEDFDHILSRKISLDYVPPYLGLLIRVCRQLRLTHDHSVSVKELEAALKESWKRSGYDTDHLKPFLIERMATILREPGAKRGRAEKS